MQVKWILELPGGEIKSFPTAGEAMKLRKEKGGDLYDIFDWQREAKRREQRGNRTTKTG